MWRMKVTAVTIVVLGALMFGAMVAYAGWGWNAKVNIEGTMVSTSWSVADGSGANDYNAVITLDVPENADVRIVKVAHRREFLNVNKIEGLQCNADGSVDVTVTFEVTGGDGLGVVSASIDRVGGKAKESYGSDSGPVGTPLSWVFTMPGNCTDPD